MRIALINPMGPKNRFDDSNDQLPPLGLLSLAAAVRPRHEVCVLDGELLKRTSRSLLECLPFEPDMLGIGGTTSQAGEAQALARSARAAFPNAKIVAGGTHATILGEDYLRQCEAFDVLVRGPGEAPFAMLADGKDPAAVPQTIIRDGDGFRSNLATGIPDLDALAPPARDLVRLHHYPGTSHRLFRQTSIMATRGCPFHCSFCSNAVWGRRWRARPIESIIAELQAIEAMDFAEVFFQDDTLNANPEWTLELFRAIRKAGLGLEYKVEFRANARLLPKRLLEAAREAGVREIFFGVESGNDAVREAAGKNLPRKDILRAVRAAQEHGIATLCAFIVGLPGETAETVQETLRFARELDPDSAGFSIATPFPGTELRAQAVREGLLLSDGYEALTLGVPVMRTKALTCAEVAELRDEAGRQWAAHIRSRSPDAEKRIRSLEERSCREALALAMARDDGVGQAIISARLARLRLDGGDNAEAIELSVGPLSELALGAYDLAKAGVVLAIALRREGLLREAATALRQIGAIAHPAHREWIAREWEELAAKARQTGVPGTELAGMLLQTRRPEDGLSPGVGSNWPPAGVQGEESGTDFTPGLDEVAMALGCTQQEVLALHRQEKLPLARVSSSDVMKQGASAARARSRPDAGAAGQAMVGSPLAQLGYKSYADYVLAERAWDPRVFGDWQISYGEMMDAVFEIGGKPVLDIGCSAGALTYSFHLRKADVRGCDIDKESIAISPFLDIKGRLVAMDTNRLLEQFDPGGFRLVHSQQVFEHFPSWEYATEVVHAVRELLTPGSFFYCSLVWGENLPPDELRNRRAAGESVDITHVNIQPRDRWEKLFAKEGFVDVGAWLSPILKCYQTPGGFSYYQEYHWHQFFLMKPGQFDVAAHAGNHLAALLDRQRPYARTEVYREVLNEPGIQPEMLDIIRGYTTLSAPVRTCGGVLSPV